MKNKYIPDRYELSIIKSLSRAFESAIYHYHFDLKDFIEKFITTDIFKNYELDYTVYSQAPTYPIGKAIEELEEKNIHFKIMNKEELKYIAYYAEAARWIGYVLMYWKFAEDITAQDILQYNIDEIIDGYDILHTQSIQYAINFIKEEYKLAS